MVNPPEPGRQSLYPELLTCRVKFPLYVSQDGKEPHAGVRDLVQSFVDRGVSYLHHKEEVLLKFCLIICSLLAEKKPFQ